jgi:Uma2 family endonuclease
MVPDSAMPVPSLVIYPESDGMPMANNTEQFRWISVLCGNLSAMYRDNPNVFIAADLFWYPVEGQPEARQAPDVLVVLGRPKGKRGSYPQWKEGNIPVTVAFEILSPGNTGEEMVEKHAFYEDHGVEEYYVYNPDTNRLHVYLRKDGLLLRCRFPKEFISPVLKIRFELTKPEMTVYYPDNRRFLTFEELEALRVLAEQRAEKESQRADHEAQRADAAEQRARRLAELSRAVRLGQASPQ